MRNLLLLFILLGSATIVNSQAGTVVNYLDNFGPIILNYDGLVNGKHSYQGVDGTAEVTVRWTGSQWGIFINVNNGGDVLSFASAVITASNPPNFTIGNWIDTAADGTDLLGLSGSGTTGTVLPVEYLAFNAMNSGKTILLIWITAGEVNNDGFDIERSSNGRDWQVIGYENSVGTTTEIQNYKFTDSHPNNGVNYYRLKQVDYDGKYDYSSTVLTNHIGDKNYSVGPNPFNDFLKFTSSTQDYDSSLISIYNAQGLKIKELICTQGEIVDTDDLVPGVYYVHFLSEEIVKLVKL